MSESVGAETLDIKPHVSKHAQVKQSKKILTYIKKVQTCALVLSQKKLFTITHKQMKTTVRMLLSNAHTNKNLTGKQKKTYETSEATPPLRLNTDVSQKV